MSTNVNKEFIIYQTNYKCKNCETFKREISELKNGLLMLTKIDNGILQQIMNRIKTNEHEILNIKSKMFEDSICDSFFIYSALWGVNN